MIIIIIISFIIGILAKAKIDSLVKISNQKLEEEEKRKEAQYQVRRAEDLKQKIKSVKKNFNL